MDEINAWSIERRDARSAHRPRTLRRGISPSAASCAVRDVERGESPIHRARAPRPYDAAGHRGLCVRVALHLTIHAVHIAEQCSRAEGGSGSLVDGDGPSAAHRTELRIAALPGTGPDAGKVGRHRRGRVITAAAAAAAGCEQRDKANRGELSWTRKRS